MDMRWLKKQIIQLTLVITIAHSMRNLLIPPKTYLGQELVSCVSKIYEQFPDYTTKLYISLIEIDTKIEFLNDISVLINKGVVERFAFGGNSEIDNEFIKSVFGNQVIIMINDDLSEIYQTISFISSKYRSFLLYIHMGSEPIEEVFERAIYYYTICRVLVIDTNGYVYGINEFGKYCALNNSYELLFQCDSFEAEEIYRVHQNRPIKDLRGCPIYTQYDLTYTTFLQRIQNFSESTVPNIEYKLLSEASKSFNSSVILQPSYFHNSNRYTIYFGAKTLQEDYIGGGFYPIFNDEYVIIVSPGAKIPNWKGLIYVFDSTLWYTIFTSCILFSLITYIMAQFAIHPENYDQFSYLALQFYGMILVQGSHEPKRMVMKTIVTLWLFFSFIIINAYNGLFLTHLLQPLYEKTPNSLDELYNGGYVIRTNLLDIKLIGILIQFNSAKYPKLLSRKSQFVDVIPNHFDFSKWRPEDKIALTIKRSEINFIRTVAKHKFEFHIIPLANYWLAMYSYMMGYPLIQPLNARMIWLHESGFTEKWMQDILEIQKPTVFEEDEFEVLTLNHVALAFYILLSGSVLATLVLIYEHYRHKYQQFKQNKQVRPI